MVQPAVFTDFSGGISENTSADSFAPDAVARAKGFVLTGTTQIRTQWACEAVGTKQFIAISGFDSWNSSFLLGLDSSGQVWWAVAPDDDVAVVAPTWNLMSSGSKNGANPATPCAIPADVRYQFCGLVPADAADYVFQSYTSEEGGAGTLVSESDELELYAKSGMLVNACYDDGSRPSAAFVLYEPESAPGTLVANVFCDEEQRYPQLEDHPSISGLSVPVDGVLPHANVATMWGDRLLLADVFWFAESTQESTTVDTSVDDAGTPADTSDDFDVVTTTFTYATMRPSDAAAVASKRYRNAIWVSEPGQPYTFDNLSLDIVVPEDAQIVRMEVLDRGLLLYTTNATGESGLVLLEGSSGKYVVRPLRSLGAARRVDGDPFVPAGCLWEAAGSFVFVDRRGGVWASDASQVFRLDGPGSVDFDGGAVPADHVAALGNYLFLAHSGRLLVMRSFGGSAAWTELLSPGDGVDPVACMVVVGESLFFLQGGSLFRFGCGRPDGHGVMPAGAVSDVFRFDSATIVAPSDDGEGFGRAQWLRSGVVLSGDGAASVSEVRTFAGPALSAGVDVHAVALSELVGVRDQVVVPSGVGFVREGAVGFSVSGDVSLDAVVLWFAPGAAGF